VAFLSKRKHPTETRLAGWGGNSHGWGIIRGFSTTWLDMKALDTVNCTVIFCCQTEARNRDSADASTNNLRTLAVGSAIASYPSHLIVGGRRRTSARPNCGSLCLRVSVQRALARIAECADDSACSLLRMSGFARGKVVMGFMGERLAIHSKRNANDRQRRN
jgi:hypothetical protein